LSQRVLQVTAMRERRLPAVVKALLATLVEMIRDD
jgi:hypothetical protein